MNDGSPPKKDFSPGVGIRGDGRGPGVEVVPEGLLAGSHVRADAVPVVIVVVRGRGAGRSGAGRVVLRFTGLAMPRRGRTAETRIPEHGEGISGGKVRSLAPPRELTDAGEECGEEGLGRKDLESVVVVVIIIVRRAAAPSPRRPAIAPVDRPEIRLGKVNFSRTDDEHNLRLCPVVVRLFEGT